MLSHFQNTGPMAGNDAPSRRPATTAGYTCTDPGVYAYVHPDQFGAVYVCGAFWDPPPLGTDSKAGALVRVHGVRSCSCSCSSGRVSPGSM